MSEPERLPSDDSPRLPPPLPPLRLVPPPPEPLRPLRPGRPPRPFPGRLYVILVMGVLAMAWAVAFLALGDPSSSTGLGPTFASQSVNWAGYEVGGGRFTSVTATWTVPAVKPGLSTDLASFWVGLDGQGTGLLEQVGTASGHLHGVPYYRAWYEMLPGPAVYPGLRVSPGDSVTGSVTTRGDGLFTLALHDDTTGRGFSIDLKQPSTPLATAEVVAEAPWASGFMPLANFGEVRFTEARVNGRPIGSYTGGRIDMVRSGLKAATSPLDGEGAAFKVTWVRP
ncbi:MAG: G1 family glutamic endopeptidase [Thermoleophilia bacterium]